MATERGRIGIAGRSVTASSGRVALMIAPCRPSATACVGSIETSTSPTAANPARYSANERAPAMQPLNEPRSARSSALSASSATTSLIPIRPPGRRTRAISASTAALSAARLMTQLLMTTSIEAAGSGIDSIVPRTNSTLSTPASAAFRTASASISSVMSRPIARPVGPTRRAERMTSIPPPEPRSRTRSPGRSSATAVGLPQPRLARTAASGSPARSSMP